MRISRRSFVATGLAVATLVPRRAFAQMSDNEKALYEAAKSDRELTWYSSHYTSETSERIGRAFTAKYSGVKVNVVRTTRRSRFNG
jgi:iron(III) transport system substrate-binding protein